MDKAGVGKCLQFSKWVKEGRIDGIKLVNYILHLFTIFGALHLLVLLSLSVVIPLQERFPWPHACKAKSSPSLVAVPHALNLLIHRTCQPSKLPKLAFIILVRTLITNLQWLSISCRITPKIALI